ncbi:type II secretion system F family protein [Kineosporia sp. J2-2]|uniref:Type II secretion system F family protein n=1 Tax=Kineosporia corallincola TaxID=2835133 RepID=A0ABS5TTY4_9ACTN|nr:type II secretion system F family protein [Kineosporia corallincola]MBT0774273.1 type II secretion system F family protein [Kineosporia corallincola]
MNVPGPTGVLVLSGLLAVSVVAAANMLFTELRGLPRHHGEAPRWWRLRANGVRGLSAAVPAVTAWWVSGWPVAGAACAALVTAWPAVAGGRRAERRQIEVLEAVVSWSQGLRDTVAGGASLEQAISVSVEGASPVLQPALEEVRSRMLVREPLDAALQPLAQAPGADVVVAALVLAARRRGDRLPEVLSGIVDTCAQEVGQRRQILANRAGIHRSVQIIVGVTVLIFAYLATFGAAYMAPYDSFTGQLVLAAVVAVIGAGFTWLARLGTTTAVPRFLTELTPGEQRVVQILAGSTAHAPGFQRGTTSTSDPASSATAAAVPTRPTRKEQR